MADFSLVLGGVVFQDFEIPESIRAGGAQAMQTHKYGDGSRTVDAFGPDDDAITWHGTFFDTDAEPRCQQIDTLRRLGTPVTLSWSSFNYLVVIKHFEFDSQRYYQIEYSIELEVVQDNTQASAGPSADLESTIQDDAKDMGLYTALVAVASVVGTAIEIAETIENIIANPLGYLGTLAGVLGFGAEFSVLSSLVNSVLAFAATLDGLDSVTGSSAADLADLSEQIATTLATAKTLQATADGSVDSLGQASLYVAGTAPTSFVENIEALVTATTTLADLQALVSTLGRLQRNVAGVTDGSSESALSGPSPRPVLASSGAGNSSIVVAPGDDLFRIATEIYGDPAGWGLIATANDLIDPIIQIDATLIVPDYNAVRANDGILSF